MLTLTLFIFALASSTVADTVTIDSLPITANLKLSGGTLPDRDRARFKALFSKRHEGRDETVKLKNTAVHYTLRVGVGSPPTYYEMLVDTGSAYTWLGAVKKYVKTKASFKQPQSFYAAYGSGSAVGRLGDAFSDFEYHEQVARRRFLDEWDGWNGLGPAALSESVLSPSTGKPVPTIMDALVAQKKVSSNVFGISFSPTTSRGAVNGELSFGGTSPDKYTGKLNWVDITKKDPWKYYWGYEQTIEYGNQTLQAASAGVVDTGTTLVYITPKAFKTYSDSLPGSKIDPVTKLLEIPQESVGKMQSLFFVINGVSYEFTPNAQLWPRALNTALGGKADAHYSIISALSDFEADTGSNFINGYVFLERFYTAYDSAKSRIGFANTPSTHISAN